MKTVEYKGLTSLEVNMDIKNCLENRSNFCPQNNQFEDANSLFLHTSDRVSEIVPDIVKDESRILTVASSGDYLLECVLNGAKDIVAFDINKYQYYITCLKVWAVQTLEYEEYISFMHDPLSSNFMAPNMINKIIKHFTNKPAYTFWKTFSEYRAREIALSKKVKKYFSAKEEERLLDAFLTKVGHINNSVSNNIEKLFEFTVCSNVLNSDKFKALSLLKHSVRGPEHCKFSSDKNSYKLTKEKIRDTNLSFIKSDVVKLNNVFGEKDQFDGIFLSNIPFFQLPNEFVQSFLNLIPLTDRGGMISYYLHNMHTSWFEESLNTDAYLLGDKYLSEDVSTADRYSFMSVLEVYKMLKANNINITLNEVPTCYGLEGIIDSNTDVKCLIKKR